MKLMWFCEIIHIRLVMLQSVEIYESEAIEYDLTSKAEFYI